MRFRWWIAGVVAGVALGLGGLPARVGLGEPLERLKDANGMTIGYLQRQGEKTFVKDRCFQTLGWVTKDGTFTDTGIRKSGSPFAYLLLESPRNCANKPAK
ncbi:MAG: hypothetical protein FJ144_16190 [Deltaproteobacteria bacterium]|nr:hypothetical protein [Deltaproteobacteria bacterium]